MRLRWQHAIVQNDAEVRTFVHSYCSSQDRRCALICGAGFDPRTLAFPQIMPEALRNKTAALCLREERPKPQPVLRPIAEQHTVRLKDLFRNCNVVTLPIIDEGNNLIGGRGVIRVVDDFLTKANDEERITDVLIDISALSCGVFFPLCARLLERVEQGNLNWNLHLFVAENPQIDIKIRGEISDTVSQIHGFRSVESLSQTIDHATLWVPVFAEGNEAQMRLIHAEINQPAATVDISPIVPFPGLDPRRPDALVEHYRDLIREWEVDLRHLLYAGESDPLDSYRSICAIDQLRHETYESLGGTSTIVSPLGGKMLSVGLMLAAIERRLRTVYVECRGYEEISVPKNGSGANNHLPITHLWLQGEIYSAWH